MRPRSFLLTSNKQKSWILLNTYCAPQEFFTYLISLDWISDSCYNKTADILGFHLDICYLRTSSITPNCQINQWSWIQLNTKCAPQEFLTYLISIDLISDSCYILTADFFGVFTLIYVTCKPLASPQFVK